MKRRHEPTDQTDHHEQLQHVLRGQKARTTVDAEHAVGLKRREEQHQQPDPKHRNARGVGVREEEGDEVPGGGEEQSEKRKEDQGQFPGGIRPQSEDRFRLSVADSLAHLDHHHAARGAGDDVDQRDLKAADGVGREGRGIEAPRDHVVVEVGLDHFQADRKLQGQGIRQLPAQAPGVRPQLGSELAPHAGEQAREPERGKADCAGQQRFQRRLQEHRRQHESRPRDARERINARGPGVPAPRDQDDFEGGRREGKGQVPAQQRQRVVERGVPEPPRDRPARRADRYEANRSGRGQRQDRVGGITSCPRRLRRHEVIQTLGHSKLGQGDDRRVDEKELFVRAELGRGEDPGEDDRDEEGRGKRSRAAANEQRRRPEDRTPLVFRGRDARFGKLHAAHRGRVERPYYRVAADYHLEPEPLCPDGLPESGARLVPQRKTAASLLSPRRHAPCLHTGEPRAAPRVMYSCKPGLSRWKRAQRHRSRLPSRPRERSRERFAC